MQHARRLIRKGAPLENGDLHETEDPHLAIRIYPFGPRTGIGTEHAQSHGIDMEFSAGVIFYKLKADPDIGDAGNICKASCEEPNILGQGPRSNWQVGL